MGGHFLLFLTKRERQREGFGRVYTGHVDCQRSAGVCSVVTYVCAIAECGRGPAGLSTALPVACDLAPASQPPALLSPPTFRAGRSGTASLRTTLPAVVGFLLFRPGQPSGCFSGPMPRSGLWSLKFRMCRVGSSWYARRNVKPLANFPLFSYF